MAILLINATPLAKEVPEVVVVEAACELAQKTGAAVRLELREKRHELIVAPGDDPFGYESRIRAMYPL